MAGSIFLETSAGLVEMAETRWEAEERLQELLAKYPNMLAGEQMNESMPRQWLLVSREFGIPGEVDAGGRWSLDHLFLDQDAIPTLVEVKRSTDTRIRREVVGQMLDYASNLATNVSAERIRQIFELRLGDGDAITTLQAAFGPDVDMEAFWQRVKDNIAGSKMRLVFVADEFPAELKRIVEFLNRQMQQTDVFAVEVRQYVSPDGVHRTLVPRLVGKVESKTGSGQATGPRVRWDRERFEAVYANDPTGLAAVRELLRFGPILTGREVEWGNGQNGQFTVKLGAGYRVSLFSVYASNEVSINFGWTMDKLDASLSDTFRAKANEIFHKDFSADKWRRGWPLLSLVEVASDLPRFENYMSECAKQLIPLLPTGTQD